MDTKGFETPTEMPMSLMFHPSINKKKNPKGLNKVYMKLLTDFCVSQPIPLLGMTTEDKCVQYPYLLFSGILVLPVIQLFHEGVELEFKYFSREIPG